MIVNCEHCGQSFAISDDKARLWIGERAPCPTCQASIFISPASAPLVPLLAYRVSNPRGLKIALVLAGGGVLSFACGVFVAAAWGWSAVPPVAMGLGVLLLIIAPFPALQRVIFCPRCNYRGHLPDRVNGVFFLFFLFCGIFPALIYYLFATRNPARCPACGNEVSPR